MRPGCQSVAHRALQACGSVHARPAGQDCRLPAPRLPPQRPPLAGSPRPGRPDRLRRPGRGHVCSLPTSQSVHLTPARDSCSWSGPAVPECCVPRLSRNPFGLQGTLFDLQGTLFAKTVTTFHSPPVHPAPREAQDTMDGSLCDARVSRVQHGSPPHCPRHSPFPGSWWLPRDDAPHPVGLAIPLQPRAGSTAMRWGTEKAVNVFTSLGTGRVVGPQPCADSEWTTQNGQTGSDGLIHWPDTPHIWRGSCPRRLGPPRSGRTLDSGQAPTRHPGIPCIWPQHGGGWGHGGRGCP